MPPQSQGSEPWRGVKPKTKELSEFGKRTPGGSQTLGNRVWCGPDHTETVPRPEDRSGGAPEREEPVDLTAQSLGLKGISPRSPAEKATEPSSVTTSSSLESLRETFEVIIPLSVKRKALMLGNPSPESDIAPKTPGGGKRRKGSTDVGTPRRTLARKTVGKQKGNPEGDLPSQNSVPTGEKMRVVGTDSHKKEHKAPTLVIPRKVRCLELKRKLGQNKAFLPALERALDRAKGGVPAQVQSLGRDRTSGEGEESHSLVWLLEESIQKIKAGTYHST